MYIEDIFFACLLPLLRYELAMFGMLDQLYQFVRRWTKLHHAVIAFCSEISFCITAENGKLAASKLRQVDEQDAR